MTTTQDQPIITFKSQSEWTKWLSQNHDKSNGVWIKFYKKGSGLQTFNYDEALDEALCYGWIDGQTKRYDDQSYLQKFTPRRSRSMWSLRNTGIVENLIKQGRMQPSGLAEVERAKADGRWTNAYSSPANTVVPEDFLKEISKNKKAEEFFKKLNKTNTYAMIWQINNAKKQETRDRRIKKFVEMLAREEKLY